MNGNAHSENFPKIYSQSLYLTYIMYPLIQQQTPRFLQSAGPDASKAGPARHFHLFCFSAFCSSFTVLVLHYRASFPRAGTVFFQILAICLPCWHSRWWHGERGEGRKNRNLRNLLKLCLRFGSSLLWFCCRAVVTHFTDASSQKLPGQERYLKGWCPNERGLILNLKSQWEKE